VTLLSRPDNTCLIISYPPLENITAYEVFTTEVPYHPVCKTKPGTSIQIRRAPAGNKPPKYALEIPKGPLSNYIRPLDKIKGIFIFQYTHQKYCKRPEKGTTSLVRNPSLFLCPGT